MLFTGVNTSEENSGDRNKLLAQQKFISLIQIADSLVNSFGKERGRAPRNLSYYLKMNSTLLGKCSLKIRGNPERMRSTSGVI